MNRVIKKTVSIATVLILLTSVVGYAGKADGKADGKVEKTEEVKTIKVGLLNELTGPFSVFGGLSSRGQKLAIEVMNESGVLGNYKLEPVEADVQSDMDIAVKEATRLITEEKVDLITGLYSSSFAIPIAEICENNKTLFWNATAAADKLLKDKHYNYVFRISPSASMSSRSGVDFVNNNYKKFGVSSVNELKIAAIGETSEAATERQNVIVQMAEKYGMNIVFNELYPYGIKDIDQMAEYVTKLKDSNPDVIFHSGGPIDTPLFMAAAKKEGLKTKAIIATLSYYYPTMPLIDKNVGKGTGKYIFETFPLTVFPEEENTMQFASPETVKLYNTFDAKFKEKNYEEASRYSVLLSFYNTWILLNNVMPIAIKKYGDINSENLRKACLELNIPERSSCVMYGVKFAPPEDEFAGQNTKAYISIKQYNGEIWTMQVPEFMRISDPVIPIASDSIFAK